MIFDQRLSHVRHTLSYNESTLSLRPRAAATKNKMRMAEKAFIFLIRIKKIIQGTLYITNFFELDYGIMQYLTRIQDSYLFLI
jgi:hypothetical protein